MKTSLLMILAMLMLVVGFGCVGYVDSDRGGYYDRDRGEYRGDRDRGERGDERKDDRKDDRGGMQYR